MAQRTLSRPRLEMPTPSASGEAQVEPTESKTASRARGAVPSFPPLGFPRSPADVQAHVLAGGRGEDSLNVQLYIDGSDAEGIRCYDENLPVSVIRALIDPNVADFFIPIAGHARTKPRAARQHFLHTSYIREIILLGDLPPEEE